MAVVLTPCTCPQPALAPIQFAGEPAVVENEICLVEGIPTNATNITVSVVDPLILNPTSPNLVIELVCCDLVVVCGFIRKIITYTPAGGGTPVTITRDVPVQIPVRIKCPDDTDVLLTPDNLSITNARVCTGCFKLSAQCASGTGTPVFHKLREKEILLFEFTYTPA
ncbi:hypothetical protein HMPREF1982_03868 [Clostridiales bacterium oral taxon 876 str. F0540]|nr:hypothetical protein HMPREF1982_03868 [Clostridiales bacterium oral taxon 876 str. F0540]